VGVVHSKFQNTKVKIEERMIDKEVKFMLSKVWIHRAALPFTGFLDYLGCWVDHGSLERCGYGIHWTTWN
jgi:hypothetical protein